MFESEAYIPIFIFLSFITSVSNLIIMFYVIHKLKSDLVDRHIELAKEQNVFLSKQQVALGSVIQVNSERLEALERLMSAIIMGPGSGGPDDSPFN